VIGLDLTELRGAAIFALAFPLSVGGVGIVTRVFYMILTGKGVNASKVRDSAEERRERQWLLWPLVVSFLVIVVFIVAAFLNGDGYWFALRDGYWFASRGTSETPHSYQRDSPHDQEGRGLCVDAAEPCAALARDLRQSPVRRGRVEHGGVPYVRGHPMAHIHGPRRPRLLDVAQPRSRRRRPGSRRRRVRGELRPSSASRRPAAVGCGLRSERRAPSDPARS
jgi:hypothetical protein